LIIEDVSIFKDVNSRLDVGIFPFTIVSDIHTPNPKSFWFKVKCPYSHDLFNLYLLKKNLEVNLQNHLGGSKHIWAIEDSQVVARKSCGLLTRRS